MNNGTSKGRYEITGKGNLYMDLIASLLGKPQRQRHTPAGESRLQRGGPEGRPDRLVEVVPAGVNALIKKQAGEGYHNPAWKRLPEPGKVLHA